MAKTFDFSRFTKKQLQIIAANAGMRKNWAPIRIDEIRGMLFYIEHNRMRQALSLSGVEDADIEDLVIEVDEPGSPVATAPAMASDDLPDLPTELFPEPPAKPITGDVNGVASALAALLASSGTNESRVAEIARTVAGRMIDEIKADFEQKLKIAMSNQPSVTIVQPVIGAAKKIDGMTHARFERVYKLASLRQNILLVGPAGCGKTRLAEQVADALGLSFSFVSCSAGMSESQLQGWLLPTGEHGAFSYVPTAFVTAYENGGVFLLDELDAADENLLLIINSALANGQFAIPQRYDNPVAKRHPDFVMIAAANTFGNGADRVYAGRNQLDGATLDRFRNGVTTMDYDANVEGTLVDPEVLTWGAMIRAKINANKLRRVMSTRVLIGYTAQKAAGFTRAEWEESYFSDWSADEMTKVGYYA